MKKILFVTRTKNINGGGEKIFLNSLLGSKLLTSSYSCNVFFIEGEDNNCLGGKKIMDEYLFFKPFCFLNLLKNVINSDLVHFNSVSNISTCLLALIARVLNKNIIISFHSNMNSTIYDNFKLLRKVRKFLVVNISSMISKKMILLTNFQKNEFKNFCIFRDMFTKKSLFIYNFVDKENVLKNNKNFLNFEIIFLGRFSLNKGSSDLIEVAELLGDIPISIFGKKRNTFKEYPKNLIFLGETDHDEILNHLEKANILFSPSHDETFSLSILEAMAKGLVVACSDLPQIREWFKDGRNGFLFPVGDVKKMFEVISYLKNNPKEVEKISKNNLEDVLDFTTEKNVLNYLKLYEDVLK